MSRSGRQFRTCKSATHTSRTFETFGWRAKESLGALSVRNNAEEAHFQVDVLKLRRFCSSGALYSATSTGTRPWRLSEIELWWQTDQASRIFCGQTLAGRWKSLGMKFSEIEVNELKIKIPAIYSRCLYILSQYNLLERVRKGTDRKTRRNRARYFLRSTHNAYSSSFVS